MLRCRSRVVRNVSIPEEVTDVTDMSLCIISLLKELVHEEKLSTHLVYLLFKRHSVQEVLNSLIYRKLRILIRILPCICRNACHCKKKDC